MDRKIVTVFLCLSLAFVVAYWLEKWSTRHIERVPVIDIRPPSPSARLAASWTSSRPRTVLQKQKKVLSFPEHKTLPHHEYLKSSEEFKNATWVIDLYDYLQTTVNRNVSPHVNLVFADYKHRALVANWVVATKIKLRPPLHNVLVLSLDQLLCSYLANSMLYMSHPPDVACIAAPVDTILSSKGDNKWKASMMIRPIILRLINYWGYDVATYDSDAVVLKNPRELYKRYTQDILSSASYWPDYQSEPWGFTVCAGAIFYRASPGTEVFWRYLSNVTGRADQVSLNKALQNMNISWKKTTPLSQVCSTNGWEGEADGGLKVFVFPQRLFCRRDCCRGHSTERYVVHPGGDHGHTRTKGYSLEKVNAWFISVLTITNSA